MLGLTIFSGRFRGNTHFQRGHSTLFSQYCTQHNLCVEKRSAFPYPHPVLFKFTQFLILSCSLFMPLLQGDRYCRGNGADLQFLDILNETLRPPLPQIWDGKLAHFSLHVNSSLILGGSGVSVTFYSIRDCNLAHFKWNT